MAKRTKKAQNELDDAIDSLGGGTIRPPKRPARTAAKGLAGTRKATPRRAVKRR